jgi:predicted regulator of Ras-like GTPase activity (Roadblock/LC7/MglB family)
MDDQALATLRRVPGVAAAYVVDGQGVQSTVDAGAGEPPALQGALLAAMVGALRQAAADLELGDLKETILEAENGAIMAASLAGGRRAAVVLADGKANLGTIRVELRRLRRSE